MESCCINCGKPLEKDEIGAYRKLVNRGATKFLCINCLAEHFKCPTELIYHKVEFFKSIGCTLFV